MPTFSDPPTPRGTSERPVPQPRAARPLTRTVVEVVQMRAEHLQDGDIIRRNDRDEWRHLIGTANAEDAASNDVLGQLFTTHDELDGRYVAVQVSDDPAMQAAWLTDERNNDDENRLRAWVPGSYSGGQPAKWGAPAEWETVEWVLRTSDLVDVQIERTVSVTA